MTKKLEILSENFSGAGNANAAVGGLEMEKSPNLAPGLVFHLRISGEFVAKAHGYSLTAKELSELAPAQVGALLQAGFMRDIASRPASKRAQRVEDIRAGVATPMTDRTTKRYNSALERLIKTVAKERAIAVCLANGLRLPKGKALREAVEFLLADQTSREDIEAEATALQLSNNAATARSIRALAAGERALAEAQMNAGGSDPAGE